MTLDRDIRVTPDQITVALGALRGERDKRRRSIARAEEAMRAGRTVQRGTLDRHHDAVKACDELIETFEVARRQIVHVMKERLGVES